MTPKYSIGRLSTARRSDMTGIKSDSFVLGVKASDCKRLCGISQLIALSPKIWLLDMARKAPLHQKKTISRHHLRDIDSHALLSDLCRVQFISDYAVNKLCLKTHVVHGICRIVKEILIIYRRRQE